MPGPELRHLSLEVAGSGVATLRIDRPPMNALSAEVQDELVLAAAELTERTDVRAVVVWGGPRVLAAGADVKEMATMSYADMVLRVDRLQAGLGALAAVPKPTVCAITGYALGGGLEVALACDVRVAGDDARLGVPEIQLGIIPGGGGTQRLARLVGPARAKDLCFTGRHVRAEEALRIGLVDEVVAPDDVLSAATARAERYAQGPALALRAAKAAIDRGIGVPIEDGLAIERDLFAGLFATEDRERGLTSFLTDGPGKATFVGR